MKKIQHFIDGRFAESSSGKTFPDINPATGETIAEVSLGTGADVERAVACARAALEGPWGKMRPMERLELLQRVSSRIAARFDDFLHAEIGDTGKPLSFARQVDIPRGVQNFRFFAELAQGSGAQTFETQTPDGTRAVNYALRVPLGVVGVISPWNLPLLLTSWKVAPALAMGNTVVVKPSRETPATAALLGEVMAEAEVPAGVYNVIQGFGETVGEALAKHPGIDGLTFT